MADARSARLQSGKRALTKTRGRKVTISVRLPTVLYEEFNNAIARDGYTSKKKSVWLEEALFAMAKHDEDLSESTVGDRAFGLNDKSILVRLSREGRELLKDLIVRLRLQVPTIEGVQSLVLRSAIRFRIRHPKKIS